MGTCGCGDFCPFAKFDGPPGFVYALAFYPGCDDCDTPAGLVVYRFSGREAERWEVEELPEAPWNDYGPESAEVAVPFLEVNRRTIGATFDKWWRKVRAAPTEEETNG